MDPAGARTAVLDHLNRLTNEMVDAASRLVKIPSVSGSDEENDAQAHMAGVLNRGGLDVDHWPIDIAGLATQADFPGTEVDRREAWGLVGRLAGSGDGATLMLNGHIDVVPIGDPDSWSTSAFSGDVRDGRLWGRGACDMKAGLIAAHWAVQAIRASGVRLRGDVLVASVQGEEDGGLGTFALLDRGWSADACVISEPTDLDIVPANAGALTFRLRVRGHATHASRRTDGVSVIEKFIPVWHALQELERRRHLVVHPTAARWPLAHPLSIGTVHAGDWPSSVPDLLVAEGRLGVALDEPVDAARLALEETVAAVNSTDSWLREHPVEVEWWGGQFASGRLPADSDLIGRVQAAHAVSTSRRTPDVWSAPYGSDLRLLVNQGHIPTLQYGPGDALLAHAPDESVPVDDMAMTARTLASLAIDICGLA